MFASFNLKKVVIALTLAVIFALCCIGFSNQEVALVVSGKINRKLPVYCVEEGANKVAITFDAAWGADKTQKILDILKENEVEATFFLVGFWIDKYPDMVKKIDESGCEIGNHSKTHLHMSKESNSVIQEEIDSVNNSLNELIGKKPKYFRPPFGDYNNTLIQAVEDRNMVGIQWSIDSLDWQGGSGEQIAERVTKKVKSGDIILCHNNSDHVLEALPKIIAIVKQKGYTFTTLSNMLYQDNYYIDSNGVMHQN